MPSTLEDLSWSNRLSKFFFTWQIFLGLSRAGMYGLVNILTSDPQPFSYPVGELQMQECTCKRTGSLCITALTAGFLPVVKTFTHTSRDLSTMCTTLQSKHVHLEFLFSQITPLANVSKIHTHHIWCKPNIFSLLDPSQYLPKVLQRWSWSSDEREECPCWGLILDLHVGKGTQSFVIGHLWYHRSHAAAANDSSRWPPWWLSPVHLCRQGLTYRWCRWGLALLCTFCNLRGLPLGQPDVLEAFEAEGLLAGVKLVNKSAMLVVLLFQIFAPNCFVWLAGSWCNCSLCAGF